jgi:putative endonuclease
MNGEHIPTHSLKILFQTGVHLIEKNLQDGFLHSIWNSGHTYLALRTVRIHMPRNATRKMSHYVYVILCEDGSFYTGYTKNVNARMKLHMKGKGARYTRIHRPKKIVYCEGFNSIVEAMKRERKIKRLRHNQKLKLISSRKKHKRQNR